MNVIKEMNLKEKALLCVAIICTVVSALLSVSMVFIILNMITFITKDSGIFSNITSYYYSLVVILGLQAVFKCSEDIFEHSVGFEITNRVRQKITLRLKKFSLGFYSKERLGEISTIIHKDVENIERVVGHLWPSMIADFLVAIIIGIGLFIVNVKLGLAMVSLVPFAILALVLGEKKNSKLQEKSQNDLASMVSLFVEYLKGIPLLKAFKKNTTFEASLKDSCVTFGKSSKKTANSVSSCITIFSVLMELSYAVLAIVGMLMLNMRAVSLNEFLIFIIFSREFYKPFFNLDKHWMNYIVAKDSYSRIERILNAKVIPFPATAIEPQKYDVQFENASFYYEKDEFEMKSINFKVHHGSLVALVGPSGSGKTTVTNLLLRFYDIRDGSIKVGGVDIKNIDYNHLLQNTSIVMQNVILFSDSIYENIKIGNKNATKKQVILAAKKAMIHDFIMTLPKAYDTMVGENGAGLSGGQKQRISIARALLKDSPLVILDEATSNVDPINERMIQKAISNLAVGRTIIVIAHHLKTIKNADNILVFNNGVIVESGDYNSLMMKNGLFRTLWDSQQSASDWVINS